jgi:hypothetical protein
VIETLARGLATRYHPPGVAGQHQLLMGAVFLRRCIRLRHLFPSESPRPFVTKKILSSSSVHRGTSFVLPFNGVFSCRPRRVVKACFAECGERTPGGSEREEKLQEAMSVIRNGLIRDYFACKNFDAEPTHLSTDH